MSMGEKSMRAVSHANDIDQVKKRFDGWRQSHRRGQRLPEALWMAAVDLASVHGVERIARELQVDCDRLAKRLPGVMKVREETHRAESGFIELLTPKVVGMSECVVELSNTRGAKMRVQFSGGDMAGMVGLMQAFWSTP
jgi:hypothetical protein